MDGLIAFLNDYGIDDAAGLMACIEKILDDPTLFYEMTVSERAALEGRMDKALAAL